MIVIISLYIILSAFGSLVIDTISLPILYPKVTLLDFVLRLFIGWFAFPLQILILIYDVTIGKLDKIVLWKRK